MTMHHGISRDREEHAMTNETTAPVQSLVDDVLNELENLADDLDGTYPGRGDGYGLRRAAELIRQQQALIAQHAAPVAVQGELRAKAENFVARMRKGAEDDRGAERELEGEDADEAQACAVQAYLQEGAADMVEQLLSAAPTQPAQPSQREGELLKALKPFADFFDALEHLGGCAPKAGTVYQVTSKGGDREITMEDFKAARAAISGAPPEQRSQPVLELSDADRVPNDFRNQTSSYRAGWNDCRAAMLAAPGDTAAPEQAEQDAVTVPRELLANLISPDHDTRIQAERKLYAVLGGGA